MKRFKCLTSTFDLYILLGTLHYYILDPHFIHMFNMIIVLLPFMKIIIMTE